ncbi:AAA family ATPase [Marivirga arenosa]|uniref:AAA family ATPase n=1 Tax=Marivirga arenosa TaxID=3059076 RepID=A0AA51N9C1_9BACT|nr:AAA family ATPase [Marivirga sp. ABR2-2]WMN06900.1 AAA family ATPase [Marivirga sp. ABR2-2]
MEFKRLTIREWKQFENLEIEFHPKLTVLTGANGAGKTTILNLLARHFGWNSLELATPAKDKKTGGFKFFTRFFKNPFDFFGDRNVPNSIGRIEYSSGSHGDIIIPDTDSPQYNLEIARQQNVRGFNIHSHRPLFKYANVPHIPLKKRSPREAFDLVSNSTRERILGNGRGQPSNFFIKETMLLWANQGYRSEVQEPDEESKRNYEGFQGILRDILPQSLGFQEFKIRTGELVMITKSGDFMLDAVSGGVGALIDLAWKIYLVHLEEKGPITILIDEAENHLHASMQREMLPNFLKAFPEVQFIVSTHSPLIIGSVKDSNVYALRYVENEEGEFKVKSTLLDLENKAKNATEILNEILGVSFTMPIWVENSLNDIINKHSSKEMTEQVFDDMRKELKEIGLENLMPLAIKNSLKK